MDDDENFIYLSFYLFLYIDIIYIIIFLRGIHSQKADIMSSSVFNTRKENKRESFILYKFEIILSLSFEASLKKKIEMMVENLFFIAYGKEREREITSSEKKIIIFFFIANGKEWNEIRKFFFLSLSLNHSASVEHDYIG